MENTPSSYFGNVNPDLLSLLPITAMRVLELGCGTGALAAVFRWRRPRVYWQGIERDPVAAESAKTALDAVLCADIERVSDADLDHFISHPPDTLVFGDVLEHLREPLAVLRRLVERLAPGGVVVACVPNVCHWSMVDRLLRGEWRYESQGLMDQTHLRFFSLESAQALFREAGLLVHKIRPRNVLLDQARAQTLMDQLGSIAAPLGIEVEALQQRLQALQYVLVATKPGPAGGLFQVGDIRLHQLVMAPDFMEVRTSLPLGVLNTFPTVHATSSITKTRLPQVKSETVKIFIIQRQIIVEPREEWLKTVRFLLERGWLIVCEWDDHPDLMSESIHRKWCINPWLPMTAAHACQTSTPALGAVFREHVPEVAVFENAMLELPPLPPKPHERIRIVFAALNRENVNPWLAPVLQQVLQAYPQVDITVVRNRALFDSLSIAPERKRFHDRLGYADYLTALSLSHIALLPLAGSEPERYKSDLKYIEAASRGAVCIASPAVYENSIRSGETGWIAATAEEWIDRLRQAITRHEQRNRMAEAAWQYVREKRLFCDQIERRLAWYRSLWERRDALTQALVERLGL